MKRRELLRATVFAGAAAALRPQITSAQSPPPSPSELTPAQSGVDASQDLSAPNWRPLFLGDHQNETLITLSDLIIPATDTPGAKEALVNRYIDLVLTADTGDAQRDFFNSLAYIDGESMRRYKAAFVRLTPDERDELLHSIAYPHTGSGWAGDTGSVTDPGHAHFENLKDRIMTAFYSSQIGRKELGWDGAFAHGPYQGCAHPEGDHK